MWLIALLGALTVGQHVYLKSVYVDPNVLVFNSPALVDDYRSGKWPSTRTMIENSFVVDAGTQAIVISIRTIDYPPDEKNVDPDRSTYDVGVKITNGQFKGRYGWVGERACHF